MKKLWLLTLFLALAPAAGVRAQSAGVSEVTLYSPFKYGPDFGKAGVNFQTGSTARGGRWDLSFGSRTPEGHDLLQVSASNENRTAIRDLGALTWNDSFQVPVVEPFPKPRAGEQRLVVINMDGAAGKPGESAASKPLPGPVPPGEDSLRRSPFSLGHLPPDPIGDTPGPMSVPNVERTLLSSRRPGPPPPAAPEPERNLRPPSDPIFARAVVGHIYAVHVVDAGVDYYALFRVESLASGDRCTISWKLIPSPESKDPKPTK